MWLYFFFVIYFCGIWAFSSHKHLLITLLRLEFVVVVLYFSIYFYFYLYSHFIHLLGASGLEGLETKYYSIPFYSISFTYQQCCIT